MRKVHSQSTLQRQLRRQIKKTPVIAVEAEGVIKRRLRNNRENDDGFEYLWN
jgi:hypothetical protein